MGIFLRPAATAVAATALLLSAGATAHAQSETIKDKSSDVIRYADIDDEVGTVLNYSDSVASGVDLRSMRVKHTKKSVSVNLKLSHLSDDTSVVVMFRLNGAAEPSRMLVSALGTTGFVMTPGGNVRCHVPLKTRTGKSGSINAVIKRSCLGNPKKLKATVGSATSEIIVDDAPYSGDILSPTAVRTVTWTKWLKAS